MIATKPDVRGVRQLDKDSNFLWKATADANSCTMGVLILRYSAGLLD